MSMTVKDRFANHLAMNTNSAHAAHISTELAAGKKRRKGGKKAHKLKDKKKNLAELEAGKKRRSIPSKIRRAK